jgi:acyl-CoA synthetase (AMP-forming)/AMP-acid ligase II
MNTADYLLKAAFEPENDNRPVILANGQSHTYGELKQACSRMAGELLSIGVEAGDRVGILSDNSIFWVASYLAILKIGAVAVPFPVVATPGDLRRRQQVVHCRAVCIELRLANRFVNTFDEAVTMVASDVLFTVGPSRWEPPQPDFDVHLDAALMLTSGTTSLPRAVRITHRNIQANTDSIIEYLQLDNHERILVVLPFYYCFGASLLHTHLRAGGSIVLCNTFAYPETALDLLEIAKCTGFAGVPSTFQTLLRNTSFRTRPFASLRKVQQAGGKLQPVYLRDLVSTLPNARVYTMYGQTEATARLSYLPPEYLETKLGSIGKGIPGVSLEVVDEAGKTVKPGEVGEIVVSGDNISPGYLGDAESSLEKFGLGNPTGHSGWMRSGDLATVDEDGFIYIVDRKSDFIKSLGHRVSSQEIEGCVLELIPELVAAAAIGQADPVQGEAIQVFVTLRSGSAVTAEDMLRKCRASMARHMVPKEIIILDAMPTNANGKVVKTVLREQTAKAALAPTA